MRKFKNDLIDCLRKSDEVRRVVLMGDMNGKVGYNKVAWAVGEWDVERVKKNGENRVNICIERKLFFSTHFQHKMIHKYT